MIDLRQGLPDCAVAQCDVLERIFSGTTSSRLCVILSHGVMACNISTSLWKSYVARMCWASRGLVNIHELLCQITIVNGSEIYTTCFGN